MVLLISTPHPWMHGLLNFLLRGKAINRHSGTQIDDIEENETLIIRFIEEPDQNSWNQLRKLTDKEIASLAKCMVAQVKLKGPFLSYSDFVNRRLSNGPESMDSEKAKGSVQNFVTIDLEDWELSLRPTRVHLGYGVRCKQPLQMLGLIYHKTVASITGAFHRSLVLDGMRIHPI